MIRICMPISIYLETPTLHAKKCTFLYLQRLPTSSIHITFESSGDHARDPMIEPSFSKQFVVALLIEKQLMMATEGRVDFAVTVEIGCVVPASMAVVKEQDHAFANVYEDADVTAASGRHVSGVFVSERDGKLTLRDAGNSRLCFYRSCNNLLDCRIFRRRIDTRLDRTLLFLLLDSVA